MVSRHCGISIITIHSKYDDTLLNSFLLVFFFFNPTLANRYLPHHHNVASRHRNLTIMLYSSEESFGRNKTHMYVWIYLDYFRVRNFLLTSLYNFYLFSVSTVHNNIPPSIFIYKTKQKKKKLRSESLDNASVEHAYKAYVESSPTYLFLHKSS